VFAPFVTRISAEFNESGLHLSWQDSLDVQGPVYIYRTEQDTRTPVETEIEVPYGVQSYIDKAEEETVLDYFIVASDLNGRRYAIKLPYSNSLTLTVPRLDSSEALLLGDAVSTNQDLSVSDGFKYLRSEVQGDAVLLSFAAENTDKSLVIYRSSQEILDVQDLLEAVIIQAGNIHSPFVDYPVPGIPYYYAIIYEDDLKSGRIQLESGKNTSLVPAEVPAGRYRVGLPGPRSDVRSMPLPLISVYTAVPHAGLGISVPADPVSLSIEAQKAVSSLELPSRIRDSAEKTPRAFSQDLLEPAGGEDYTLRSIVQGSFAKRDWSRAIDELSRFLSLPRTAEAESRARFYLGQAYYFTGNLSASLFEFLLVQTIYPKETYEWIQAVLPGLHFSEES